MNETAQVISSFLLFPRASEGEWLFPQEGGVVRPTGKGKKGRDVTESPLFGASLFLRTVALGFGQRLLVESSVFVVGNVLAGAVSSVRVSVFSYCSVLFLLLERALSFFFFYSLGNLGYLGFLILPFPSPRYPRGTDRGGGRHDR
ncbi:hypothetical protein NDU88_002266 [Pleurodeles waltl]|uniref:Transmembrane protein n=1 Tax=Pleurodeles waltl TaxID=8319 RepID=A0AAV7MNC6_PLEWA|nr:hypothetical protein NDU88_002266 [Pleurodeles waltl]